ncbi:MAG TPA: ribonuclease H-like domain-containing protein [Chloroflexota bacterium]|nr:ribonuclease H-like domain-containing protein [Chloroflexota bacterium]
MQPFSFPLPPLSGAPAPLEALVQGEEVRHERGTFFRRRLEIDVDDRYGDCRMGDFLAIRPDAAAALARVPDLRDVPLESCLFLDTETTGLAGGTGTYAFLVGLGYFQTIDGDTRFVVEQCMMRSYGEERAMLSWLHEHLQRFAALITFNGRTFDVPLLQTRFLMSRMRIDFEEWLQFDLLHASRRLWRLALTSCTLQHLERHVLGVGREADVESFLIPAIFYKYLKDGDGRYLQLVFNHNRADVLAMVGIATRACAMLDSGLGSRPEADGLRLSAPEQLGLARVFEQMDSLDAAERAYRAALAGSLPVDLRCRALMGLAALLKRRRRADEAAEHWQAVVDESPLYSVPALIELSKYWEHQRRDPARAFDLARRARDRWLGGMPGAERPLPGIRWPAESRPAPDDFTRRLERLERKRTLAAT